MSRSVLVVDDDAGFRDLAVDLVQHWGHDVVGKAATVAEAVEQATALRPDTMLIDVGLPDGDGVELTARLCRQLRRPRIVLISSDSRAVTDGEAKQAGAVGFIAKSDLCDGELRRLIDG